MPDINDELGDAFIVHAVDLERFKSSLRAKALALLKDIEQDLVVAIAKGPSTQYQKARLNALLLQTRATIQTAYKAMRADVTAELNQLAKLEVDFAEATINDAIGLNMISVEISAAQLKAIVGDALIEGGPQSEWWDRQAAKTQNSFADIVRRGLVQGLTTDKIIGSLRDLFAGQLRRNIEALVRTSVASVSNEARLEVYNQNTDVVQTVMQRSVLDARTTPICMAYSGKVWRLPDYEPVGHRLPFNNGVPRHWSCRSSIVPVLPSFKMLFGGEKKTVKSAQQYFVRRMKAAGFSDEQIEVAMTDAQASMNGTVPDDLNYESWLETQSEALQREILGPTKYQLWIDGKLNFSQLVNEDGRPLTVAELLKKVA